jgi:hypothetical protein
MKMAYIGKLYRSAEEKAELGSDAGTNLVQELGDRLNVTCMLMLDLLIC